MPEEPERKKPHNIAFTPSLWAAIAAEAAQQNRSITNWLATVAAKALRGRRPTRRTEMATTKTLVRNADGTPALWLDIVRIELLHDDGRRSIDYTGTTLNDDNTSIPFDPSVEDIDVTVAQWEASFNA